MNVHPSKRVPSLVNLKRCCIFRTADVTQGGRVSYSRFHFFHHIPRVSRLAYYCWAVLVGVFLCLPSHILQLGWCFLSGKLLTVPIFVAIKIKAVAQESAFLFVPAVHNCKLNLISMVDMQQLAFYLESGFWSYVYKRFVSPVDFHLYKASL